jgi:hypothetical protein
MDISWIINRIFWWDMKGYRLDMWNNLTEADSGSPAPGSRSDPLSLLLPCSESLSAASSVDPPVLKFLADFQVQGPVTGATHCKQLEDTGHYVADALQLRLGALPGHCGPALPGEDILGC